MREYFVDAGSTDVEVTIRIAQSSSGANPGDPKTDVTDASTGLDIRYRREGAASVGVTAVDLTALTDAHTDGGLLHDIGGNYRFDPPDAAFAAGARWVEIEGVVDDGVVFGALVHLSAGPAEVNVTEIGGEAVELSTDNRLRVDAAEVADTPAAATALAANIGNLDASVASRASQTTADAIEADTQDIQGRLPAALSSGGNMRSDIQTIKQTGLTATPPFDTV